jgi:glycerol-3-phosphate dehydrogenase
MKSRTEALRAIANQTFDVCIIGAGATGSGCALDAQLRGLKTVLLDAGDFAGATSSASTKLVHGGVRYLEEAVRELDPAEFRVVNRALHERRRMLKNAPYLAHPLEFLVPCYGWAEVAYLEVGLKLYDWIAGEAGIAPSRFVSREETLRRMPSIRRDHLLGSVVYADGQFDDARYVIALVKSFTEAGGEALNYACVASFEKDGDGKLIAANVLDQITGARYPIRARVFVNATGPFADTIRSLALPGFQPRMRLSKGIHILLPLEILSSRDAMLIPKTEDGRVLFAIPWMGRLLVGTTEQEVKVADELYVTAEEIQYVLHHLNQYLAEPVSPGSIVSAIAGARPLVASGDSRDTKKLLRDEALEVDRATGLVSIMGGKWTTHRAMAEDAIDAVQQQIGVSVTECPTRDHPLIGSSGYADDYWHELAMRYGLPELTARHLAGKYGTLAPHVLDLAGENPEWRSPLIEGLAPIRAEIVYSAKQEMAMTIEDILARRIGLQLYSWRSAIEVAPVVGSILGRELGWSADREREELMKYVRKINRLLALARLASEATTTSENRS